MDIATLIGILVSFGLVVVSILVGGDGSWFLNAPSLMIVGGGTMGATLLAYPLKDVLSVFKVAKMHCAMTTRLNAHRHLTPRQSFIAESTLLHYTTHPGWKIRLYFIYMRSGIAPIKTA